MKLANRGLIRTILISAALLVGVLTYGQTYVDTNPDIGQMLHWGPPPNTIFPPSYPTLASNDVAISYHYANSGSGYWNHHSPNRFSITGLQTGVEETTVHFKQDGSQTTSSRSYSFQGESWFGICWDSAITYTSNTCSSATGCSGAGPWFTAYADGELIGDGPHDVTEPYATTSTGCGTIGTGKSAYTTDLPPGDLCQCIISQCGKLTPNKYYAGAGSVFALDLWITTNCTTDPSIVNPSGPYASYMQAPWSTAIMGSDNSMTPSGGSFGNTGTFGFNFNVPASDTYTVYASTDLVNWASVAQVSASSLGTFTDTNAPNFPKRFYVIAEGGYTGAPQINPSDAYGYARINVSTNGAIISDPFLNDGGRDIGSLLPNMPTGTTVQLWNVTNWDTPTTFSSGSWGNPQLQIYPGDGVFLKPSQNVTVQFSGQIILGNSRNFFQAGYGVRSSILPVTGTLTSLGLNTAGLTNGDYVQKWNGSGYNYYTNSSSGWTPAEPSLNLCEAIIVHSLGGAAWNQSFIVPKAMGPWNEINVQFLGDNEQTLKTNAAAVGSIGDYWNVGAALDGEEDVVGDPESGIYESISCLDNFGRAQPVTVNLICYDEPTMGLSCGSGSGSITAATDPLMQGVETAEAGGPIAVTIGGLDPHGTYDIYLYGVAQMGSFRWNTQFELLSSLSPDITTSSSNPQSTSSATGWDINTWQEGNQYVVFHNVSFTSPNSGTSRTIKIQVSGNYTSFSVINGLQIVRTN